MYIGSSTALPFKTQDIIHYCNALKNLQEDFPLLGTINIALNSFGKFSRESLILKKILILRTIDCRSDVEQGLIKTYPQNDWPGKLEKFRQRFSDAEQGLIKTHPQNDWPGKLEKFRQRFSDAEQCLIKTYPQNDWPGKLEKFRQRFSDAEQCLIKTYPQNDWPGKLEKFR